MNTSSVEGRLIGVKVAGSYYRCQTDAKLTLGTSVTQNDTCKPDPSGSISIDWETSTVDSKNWNMTFSAQAFLDSLEGYNDNSDLIELFITGDLQVEADFLTATALTETEGYSHDFIFTGPGLLSGITVNAPAKGSSTYDVTITGNGAPTYTKITKTT